MGPTAQPSPPSTPSQPHTGGLAEDCTEEMLHAAFIPFGDIVEVTIPKDFKESTCLRRAWGCGRAQSRQRRDEPHQNTHALIHIHTRTHLFYPRLLDADTNRGFGFVHYESAEDAAAAIDNMEGACARGAC